MYSLKESKFRKDCYSASLTQSTEAIHQKMAFLRHLAERKATRKHYLLETICRTHYRNDIIKPGIININIYFYNKSVQLFNFISIKTCSAVAGDCQCDVHD